MNLSPQQVELAWRLAGWTMLHYVWIGAGIALAGGAVRLACRRAAPSVKYAASLATLVALAAAPGAIAAWLALRSPATLQEHAVTPSSTPIAAHGAPNLDRSAIDATTVTEPAEDTAASVPPSNAKLDSVATVANPSPSPSLRGRGMSWFTPSLEGIVRALPWLWLVGAPLTFALLAAGLVGSRRLQRTCQPIEAGPVSEALAQLRSAMRISRTVAVALADGVAQPVLVGIVRPIILLPASAVSGWLPAELEMVLLHELAHVRRWDNLVNLVQRVIESLLFFHPAVWLVSRQVRRDREECCDAAVLRHAERPDAYASLLVSIASSLRDRRLPPMAVASAMADRALAGRIRRILNLEDEPMLVSPRTLGLFLALPMLVAAAVYTASAGEDVDQSASKPAAVEKLPPTAEQPKPEADAGESSAEPPASSVSATERRKPSTAQQVVTRRYAGNAVDRLLVQNWLNIVIKDVASRGGDVYWNDRHREIEVHAPQYVHEALGYFFRDKTEVDVEKVDLAALATDGADDQRVLMQRLFRPSDANPLRTIEYSTESLPAESLKRYPKLFSDMFDGLQKDPYGPQLRFDWAWVDQHRRLRVSAPRAAHLYFHFLFSGQSLPNQQDDRGNETDNDKNADPSATNERLPAADTTKQIVTHVPANVLRSPAARERVVNELARQGFEAVIPFAEGDPDAQLAMTITAPADLKARVVWEEGPEGPTCRVIDLSKLEPADDSGAVYEQVDGALTPVPAGGDKAAGLPEDKVHLVVYAVSDIDTVKLQQWMAIIGSDNRIEVQWLDKDKSLIIAAPKSGHTRISEFLREARDAKDEFLKGLLPRVEAESQEIRFAADADASEINKLIKGLAAAGKQVRVKRNEDGTGTVIAVSKGPATPATPTLAAGDVVKLTVVNAFPERPIDDAYRIEDQGTLALGPNYGRVAVAGMTVLQAEEAVKTHLETILTDVQVQMTLVERAPHPAPQPAPPKPPEPSYLYDGKTFDEWRDLWKYELKTERRIDALLALAAFGSREHGREAATAILEIAGEYPAGNPLEDSVRGAFGVLSNKHWTGETIAAETWLPALMERMKADPPKWSQLATGLMNGLFTASAETRKLLTSIAADPAYGPNAAALGALLRTSGEQDAELQRLVKEALSGVDQANALQTLLYLDYRRLEEFPEQFNLLFHKDAATRRAARTTLARGRFGEFEEIAQRLLNVLDDPARAGDHADAVRALGVLQRYQSRASDANAENPRYSLETYRKVRLALYEICRGGAVELIPPALVAIGGEHPDRARADLNGDSIPNDRKAEIEKAFAEYSKELELAIDPPPHPQIEGNYNRPPAR